MVVELYATVCIQNSEDNFIVVYVKFAALFP